MQRTAAASCQQTRLHSYTRSAQRLEGGARHRQKGHGLVSAWREDKGGRATYRHTPTPTKKVLQLHERLNKRENALLVRLQTEKIGLNNLFRRHVPIITSPRCSCGEGRQTIAHFLLRYSKHKDLQNRIFANLSGQNSLRTILSTPQLATKAIEYMEQTRIHGQVGIRNEQTTPSAGGKL